MKNFRKVLALVLVVATLFSFTAMAGAAKYEDADKISYDMAVDVLSAVGILNGYEVAEDEFEFHPTDKITREEMAKMIAVLANSGTDVSELYATACTFADVAKDRWSASYVAYCAKTGIVAGRSASTFDPKANVTGLETAKMLLVLLGFDAQTQGYVGADWKVNVLRDAKVMGLLSGFAADYNIEATITREEAANMMLNALQAPAVVGLVSDKIVKVTNALVFTKGTYTVTGTTVTGKDPTDNDPTTTYTIAKVSSYATLKDALSAGNWALYENVLISDDVLYKTLFPTLVISYAQADCFGRGAYGFEFSKKDIVVASGTYGAASGKAYTTQVDLAADYKTELKAYNNRIKTTIDGYDYGFNTFDAAGIKAETGNGVDTLVSVKKDATGYYVDVNIIRTYIGKVADVNDYTGTFAIDGEDGNPDVASVVAKTAVKNGQYVLYRVCNREGHKAQYGAYASGAWVNANFGVHDYEVVTPVTATVDYSRSYIAGHINMCYMKSTEGETYKYASQYGRDYLAHGYNLASDAELKAYATKALYLDKYGYIMLMTAPTTTYTVAYFDETELSAAQNGSKVVDGVLTPVYDAVMGAAVYTGADVAAVELTDVKDYTDATETLTTDSDVYDLYLRNKGWGVGLLRAYSLTSKGYAVDAGVEARVIAPETVINKTTANVAYRYGNGLTKNYVLNSDTKFMIRVKDAAAGTYTYSEIVGVQNLPLSYYVESVGTAGATTAQLLDLNADQVADYVFIDAKYAKNATEFIVLSDAHVYNASWTGVAALLNPNTYKGYSALVGGQPAIVLTTGTLDAGRLYTSALSYIDVDMTEDAGMPLYLAATPAPFSSNSNSISALKSSFGFVVGSAGDVQVTFTTSSSHPAGGGVNYSMHAESAVPVYHLVSKSATLNGNTGYWVETNKVTAIGEVESAFVVTNAAKTVVEAIYLVHTGYAG